jgi:amino-acid N-acetyltransferase
MLAYRVRPAVVGDLAGVLGLLAEAGLPLAGVEGCWPTAVCAFSPPPANKLLAHAALELHPPYALLRSVVVAPAARGQGVGQAVVAAALQRAEGITAVYLLTETASDFFPRFGFVPVAREDVPTAVVQTHEFSTACPTSALVMRLTLASAAPATAGQTETNVINDEELAADEADWQALSLSRFAAEWDNPEDEIYDNWRDHYDVPTR